MVFDILHSQIWTKITNGCPRITKLQFAQRQIPNILFVFLFILLLTLKPSRIHTRSSMTKPIPGDEIE